MRIARCFILLFILLFGAHNAWSTSTLKASVTKSHTTLHLKSSVEAIQPNAEFWLLLDWSLDPNWYMYAQNPGDGGMPSQFDFDLPAGITVEEILWPKANDLSKQGLTIYGYTDACQTFIRLKAAHDYKPSP
jgi:DsbC/DsbD-like thiol-disulfide interchange protein